MDLRRQSFNHPYKPYDIQLSFMSAVTYLLDNDLKIGLFESPTGTGKTLSLICSTVTWLRENRTRFSTASAPENDDEPDWVNNTYSDLVQRKEIDEVKSYEDRLDELLEMKRHRKVNCLSEKQRYFKKIKVEIEPENDEAFVPKDYVSDGETDSTPSEQSQKERNAELISEINHLRRKLGNDDKSFEQLMNQGTKILFSSRTHSQLKQFSSQLKLPHFPSSFKGVNQHLKYVPLGSRKQLCINPKVRSIHDVTLMNEACIELQKSDERSCEFYPKVNNQDMQGKTLDFRDYIFTEVSDIEALPIFGQELNVCPYYSVRKGIPYAEVITLPYQLLLQKNSRETLGISLKDAIVVIDEAHNLIETISSIHSVSVSINEFKLCKDSLKKYLSKFSRRMNGGNRVNLMKLIKTIDLILKYSSKFQNIPPGKVISIAEMFEGTTGDLLNVHKLEKYLSVSKIAFKIESYMDKESRENLGIVLSNTPVLFKVVDFLKAISNPSKEGEFFFDVKGPTTFLSYTLLDPSNIFKELVDEAKCVILAGGTMEPTEDFTKFLFPYVDPRKVMKFSCGHVIPRENLEVFVVGSNTQKFEFSFAKRNDTSMIRDLGESVLQLCLRIPAGVVLFVPSYKYLSLIIQCWKSSTLWESIEKTKKIFTESLTNDVLVDYSDHIASKKGGLLLSVVGGSLSEGINFSDDLARAVIMVGLPYPNAYSGDILLKKKYIEDKVYQATNDKSKAAEATRTFYENICMRAVNQSVGRSIRHINDYSVIYLFDLRYNSPRIENKLSSWIKERIAGSKGFDEILRSTETFFARTRP